MCPVPFLCVAFAPLVAQRARALRLIFISACAFQCICEGLLRRHRPSFRPHGLLCRFVEVGTGSREVASLAEAILVQQRRANRLP
jgi:hypothetical protein